MKVSNISKENIETYYFYIISVLFLFIFVFYAMKNGIKHGFKLSLFIWCLTVSTTPISTASVLLSFPIKIFTSIPMFITKFISSLFSLITLTYFYNYKYDLISKIPLGKAFIKIVKSKLYNIFLVAIIASVISSYMLDNLVDYFILSDMKMMKKDKLGKLIVLFFIFIVLNFSYFDILIKNKIFEFSDKYYFL